MERHEQSTQVRKYRRRQYFVGRRFQGRIAIRFVLGVLCAATVAGSAAYLLIASALESEMYSAHFSISRTGELVRSQLFTANTATAVVLIVLAALGMLRMTRGCTFAFKRLRAGLQRVASGDFSVELYAKAGDNLDDLFLEVNDTIKHIRASVQSAQLAIASATSDQPAQLAQALRLCASELRKVI